MAEWDDNEISWGVDTAIAELCLDALDTQGDPLEPDNPYTVRPPPSQTPPLGLGPPEPSGQDAAESAPRAHVEGLDPGEEDELALVHELASMRANSPGAEDRPPRSPNRRRSTVNGNPKGRLHGALKDCTGGAF
eukprot:gene917-5217_t